MATNSNLCEPCLRGNIESAGHSWCSDCEEVLCLACDKSHGVGKLTMSHRTTELQKLPSIPKATSLIVSLCEKHPENQLEGYCSFHDTLCCRSCILEDHRTCENIKNVDEVASNIKSSVLVDNVCKGLPALLQTLASISDNRKTNQVKIKQQDIDIKLSIAKLKVQVLQHLDSFERSLNTELTRLKDETEIKFESENKEVEDMSQHFCKLKDELDLILEYGSNRKIYLFVEKMKGELFQGEAKMQKLLSDLKNVDLEFKVKNDLLGIIFSLGFIELETKTCGISYSSLFEGKAQLSISRLTFTPIKPIDLASISDQCAITGIEITKDRNIILCECATKQVLLCNEDGRIINKKPMAGRPYQITTIPGDKVAITNIETPKISIFCTGNLDVDKALNLEKIYYGIAFLKNKFIVGAIKEIDVLTMDGHICRTISVPYSSHYIRSICISNDYTLLCCSPPSAFRLHILDENDSLSYRMTEPRGIAEDRFGNIYIADKKEMNIRRISSDGDPMGNVFTDGLPKPLAIRFNRDFNRFYVGFERCNYVGIYECK